MKKSVAKQWAHYMPSRLFTSTANSSINVCQRFVAWVPSKIVVSVWVRSFMCFANNFALVRLLEDMSSHRRVWFYSKNRSKLYIPNEILVEETAVCSQLIFAAEKQIGIGSIFTFRVL